MHYQIKKSNKLTKAIKFEIKDDSKTMGRVFLYIIKNDLHNRPYGLLEDLFVSKSHRGKGLGTRLLLRAIAEAKKRKLYKLIGTSRTSRSKVHGMYQKFGFKKYGFEFRMNL